MSTRRNLLFKNQENDLHFSCLESSRGAQVLSDQGALAKRPATRAPGGLQSGLFPRRIRRGLIEASELAALDAWSLVLS
ncbi:MAG: hypothetical protein JZU52_06995, partial [Lamprocystis purpurea]|nr:hypothetical protein [Lamprocystis purpurea]